MKERFWVNHKRPKMEKEHPCPPTKTTIVTLLPTFVSTSQIWVRLLYPSTGHLKHLSLNLVSVTMGLVLMHGLEKRIKCVNRVPGNNQRPSLAQLCSQEVFIRSPAMKANWRLLIAFFARWICCLFHSCVGKSFTFLKESQKSPSLKAIRL